jgi:adenylate cyclase, class 2
MKGVNVEIKARCGDPARVRRVLSARKAEFRGADRQVDTYFNVPRGRLKLREGKIENCLVYYERKDRKGPRTCSVRLVPTDEASAPALRALLTAALGVRRVIDKRREIYFLGNVKFHIDNVRKLGTFVEIEAQDAGRRYGTRELRAQCLEWAKTLGIADEDLVSGSYAEMTAQEIRG